MDVSLSRTRKRWSRTRSAAAMREAREARRIRRRAQGKRRGLPTPSQAQRKPSTLNPAPVAVASSGNAREPLRASTTDPLTREELAQTCGVSKSTIRRWEEKGVVHPRVNERGVRLFDLDDCAAVIGDRPIVRLPQARTHVPSAANSGGDLAAAIFELLDAGKTPVAIVRELRAHPDVVDGFVAYWLHWRKAVIFTTTFVGKLARLLHIEPTRDPAELLRRIETVVGGSCSTCKENRARFCRICHHQKQLAYGDRLRQHYGLPPRVEHPLTTACEIEGEVDENAE